MTGTVVAWVVAWSVLGTATVVVAALVRRRGGPPGAAAWTAALGTGLLATAVAEAAAARDPALLGVAARCPAVVLGLLLPGLLLTFPTGRLEHVVERVAAGVVAVGGAAVVVAPVQPVAVPAGIATIVAVAVGVGARFERTRDLERDRILWLLLGLGGAGVVAGQLVFVVEQVAGPARVVLSVVGLVAALAAPAAVGVALLAPRVADVRTVISGSAAAVVMVDLALGVVAGSLAGIELATGAPASRVAVSAVCVVVAAGFHPALVVVRGTLDQVLFGGRPDPVGVVSSLSDELRRGGDPQRWLDTLCEAADLSGAELRRGGEVVAVAGDPTGTTSTIGLHAGEEHVGDLVVGLPANHRELPRATDAVLRLVAGPLARALQSARLARELQDSRRMVVLAAEEERRRLRRDLHDGLGPVLAGVAYTADAARNVLDSRPARTAELLTELRGDVTGAIDEVRRIVHGLRPPVLDQLGLVAAVHQQAARVSEGPVAVTVTADLVGTLPAAVEVVAYRVVTEAVHNVVRHAGARTARVDLRRHDEALELEVTDDGVGGGPWDAGVGLTAMRERVEQVGGVLDVRGDVAGGRVHARLPLPA